MRSLFYLFIPIGFILFVMSIKYLIRFAKAEMIYEMPYSKEEGTFKILQRVDMDYGLAGKCLRRLLWENSDLNSLSKIQGK